MSQSTRIRRGGEGNERGAGGIHHGVEGRFLGEMAVATLLQGNEMRRQSVAGWLCGKSRRRL